MYVCNENDKGMKSLLSPFFSSKEKQHHKQDIWSQVEKRSQKKCKKKGDSNKVFQSFDKNVKDELEKKIKRRAIRLLNFLLVKGKKVFFLFIFKKLRYFNEITNGI